MPFPPACNRDNRGWRGSLKLTASCQPGLPILVLLTTRKPGAYHFLRYGADRGRSIPFIALAPKQGGVTEVELSASRAGTRTEAAPACHPTTTRTHNPLPLKLLQANPRQRTRSRHLPP